MGLETRGSSGGYSSSFWPPFGGKEDMRILLICPVYNLWRPLKMMPWFRRQTYNSECGVILEGCGCWSGGVELQLLVSTWRVQNVNTSQHSDDLIPSRSHGVRSSSSTGLWFSTPIHSHTLSLYSALHYVTYLLIVLLHLYWYDKMI